MEQRGEMKPSFYSSHFLMLLPPVLMLLMLRVVESQEFTLNTILTTTEITITTTIASTNNIEDDEDEAFIARRASLFLCQTVDGCNCDDTKKEVTCKCPNHQQTLRFSNFQIPSTVETIRILDCEYVPINHPGLSELHLKELTIKSVNQVMIGPKTLKRVDKLVIENVKEFELEQFTLDSLESNSVKIINSKIPDKSAKEMKPKLIKDELLLDHSTLPSNFAIYLTESPIKKQTAPSIVIEDCQINAGLQMVVNVTNLQMINNRFQRLPAKQSFDIHFTESVSLRGNTLMNGTRLSDVNNKGEIKKYERLLDKDAADFLDAFVFHFNRFKSFRNEANSSSLVNGATLLTIMPIIVSIISYPLCFLI